LASRWSVIAVVVLALVVVGAALAVRAVRHHRAEPAPIRQWVAVLDVGGSARELYPRAASVGEIAGVYVFVDRWACYSGFPAGTPEGSGGWFLGVAATDRSVVDGIVARLGAVPLAEAEVEQGCALSTDAPPDGPQT
jgi:hypothetical protein